MHHTEISWVYGNTLTIPLRFFYQLLYTNWYFFNTTLVVSHTYTCTLNLSHTHTHTSHLLTLTHTHITEGSIFIYEFCLSNDRSWANSIIWNIWMSDKASEKKGQVENSCKQLELKHVSFTSINMCFSNFLLRLNVKHSEIQTTARAVCMCLCRLRYHNHVDLITFHLHS